MFQLLIDREDVIDTGALGYVVGVAVVLAFVAMWG